jgi:hypothetical protein
MGHRDYKISVTFFVQKEGWHGLMSRIPEEHSPRGGVKGGVKLSLAV